MGYTRVGDLLLGLIGLALLRSRVTDLGGRAFCDARVAELRQILDHKDDPALQRDADWEDAPASEGYAIWASTHDNDPNPLIDLDEATLRPILDRYHQARRSTPPGAPDAGPHTSPNVGMRCRVSTSRLKCWTWLARKCRTRSSCSATCVRCHCRATRWT